MPARSGAEGAGGASDALARRGREIFAPHRVGRPGQGAGYWPMWTLAQAIRVAYRIEISGAELIAPGPAILVGNHLNAIDPVVLGVSMRRRVAFVAKAEALGGAAGFVLRTTGQVPLVRGDEAATAWALDACAEVLRLGRCVGVYPEATRSPDGRSLHRLHRRILAPLITANPTVAVHAVTVAYPAAHGLRRRAVLRVSAALALDPSAMTADDLTNAVRDALIRTGDLPYVDRFGRSVKAAREADG